MPWRSPRTPSSPATTARCPRSAPPPTSRSTVRFPPSFSGRYLRIGPNPFDDADRPVPLVRRRRHGARRRDRRRRGRVWYRNRWVRTDDIARAMGEEPVQGPMPPLYDTSNTHVIGHAGRILALTEGSMPYELSPTLETLRRTDFGGPLPTGFTAHPKVDPLTGEMLAFSVLVRGAVPHLSRDRRGREARAQRADHDPALGDDARLRGHARQRALLRPAGGVRSRDRCRSRSGGTTITRLESA